MHSRFVRSLSCAAICASAIAVANVLPAAATDRPPNILFILADDLGWKDVGFHGGNVPTPHLDRLKRDGLELSQHYVFTVCSATRASLLTGRYCTRFGFAGAVNVRALPWDTVTLPRALQQAGYETAISGKWHLGSKPEWGPNHFGFDHSYGSLAGGVGPWDHKYKQGGFARTWHRNESYREDEGHVTDLLAEEGVRWIASRQGKPFFLYMAFTAPHVPIREPAEWVRRVPAAITEPSRREYGAAVMHLDDAIGRLLDAVRKAGQWENTIVVFTSDNGATPNNPNFRPDRKEYLPDNYTLGPAGGDNRPLRGTKGDVYEGGIRVPTVIAWPGRLPAGKTIQEPIHIVDWMPTFCALAGYKASKDLRWDGQNIWPVLSAGRKLEPRPLYWASPSMQERAVRYADWKFVVNHARAANKQEPERAESVELFYLAEDPNEKVNLAAQRPERVRELRALLDHVARADGDAKVADQFR